jgi:hypothetical protein
MLRMTTVFVATMILSAPHAAQTAHPAMPAGMTHEEHLAQMQKDAELKRRGDRAMGFDQDRATHHFTLTARGGTIQVEAGDPSDETTRAAIRSHLREIARAFAAGDFSAPVATHAETPPGVSEMRHRPGALTYSYEETANGARVVIASTSGRAVRAVHEFLRYQIREHRTGDPGVQ